MKRDTCEMMRQCWYKDLRKPILDLPPGNLTNYMYVTRFGFKINKCSFPKSVTLEPTFWLI